MQLLEMKWIDGSRYRGPQIASAETGEMPFRSLPPEWGSCVSFLAIPSDDTPQQRNYSGLRVLKMSRGSRPLNWLKRRAFT